MSPGLFQPHKYHSIPMCVSSCIREQLLKADFSGCMKLLQVSSSVCCAWRCGVNNCSLHLQHFPLSDTQKLFLKAQELTN